MSFDETLNKILEKSNKLSEKLSSEISGEEFIKTSKEYSSLSDVVDKINKYMSVKQEIRDMCQMLLESSTDLEMKCYIESEKDLLEKRLPSLKTQIKIALLPKDEADQKNSIVEIRAGTGGDEAALFAQNLLNMYQRYAEKKRWNLEILSISETFIGGIRDASILISGRNVYSRLKFESGVHRVQRVPETESSGRVHTSAATVAVLPEAEEIDVSVKESDLQIDTYKASGAGGQHVNTTDSAVRITHIPTKIVVAQQSERSQHKNKAKAMKILLSRLYEFERMKLDSEMSSSRRQQIGSGDRSQRIRTYNFPQNRVTDHRINLTLYKLDQVMASGELDEIIDGLVSEDEAKRLCERD